MGNVVFFVLGTLLYREREKKEDTTCGLRAEPISDLAYRDTSLLPSCEFDQCTIPVIKASL